MTAIETLLRASRCDAGENDLGNECKSLSGDSIFWWIPRKKRTHLDCANDFEMCSQVRVVAAAAVNTVFFVLSKFNVKYLYVVCFCTPTAQINSSRLRFGFGSRDPRASSDFAFVWVLFLLFICC